MTDSPDGTESVGAESGDDGQLTIRIPNPKVYMARQSQWKGRRGKPRCDHCRLNNLKCDRVLPTCNHCSWANGRECKYTPLPTPAHRGIPRCDRCRLKNLKCDRSLPICNHCQEDNEEDCNYTPKKRHKVPTENQTATPKGDGNMTPYASKTASFLVSEVPSDHEAEVPAESSTAPNGNGATPANKHTFESELRTEPQIKQYKPPGSPTPGDDNAMDVDSEMFQQVGPDGVVTWVRKLALPPLAAKSSSSTSASASGSGYHRPFVLDQGMIVTTPHIDPWTHPSFAPLPTAVLQTLVAITAIEMPARHAFDEALVRFVGGLAPELRETATFIPDVYADVAHAITEGRISELSVRLQLWASCHHARSGSHKQHLLILPRDAYYNMDRADEESLRTHYAALTDGEPVPLKPEDPVAGSLATPDPVAVFDRVPVQQQIYDVLVYTHRNHSTAPSMLSEARRIGVATITWPMVEIFTRLCPLCKMRGKNSTRAAVSEEDPSASSASRSHSHVSKR
ncbi:uncharacterized protein C8Q71DRAFT_816651 [Rhodofomes roseus]|uniref:Zn(2)-C6 fungal-type domain-containing protein n=1 Tax=Rhodofomes roseus TaxID=34475 RepID=A0ABQ8K2Z8_9APHY|nr:uncharacterized protein C8Q71DRAFT_816651 [Rhodofomes roseus]KAH9831225.1 hypothetical protein C8Q71DRAFT_816651 [Rhodofomes roseus]